MGRVKAGEKITMLLPKAKVGANGVRVWTWLGVAEVLTSFLAGLGGRMGCWGVVCKGAEFCLVSSYKEVACFTTARTRKPGGPV